MKRQSSRSLSVHSYSYHTYVLQLPQGREAVLPPPPTCCSLACRACMLCACFSLFCVCFFFGLVGASSCSLVLCLCSVLCGCTPNENREIKGGRPEEAGRRGAPEGLLCFYCSCRTAVLVLIVRVCYFLHFSW